mgnify:CR=1 FL=1
MTTNIIVETQYDTIIVDESQDTILLIRQKVLFWFTLLKIKNG